MNNHNPTLRSNAEHGRSEHGTSQRPVMERPTAQDVAQMLGRVHRFHLYRHIFQCAPFDKHIYFLGYSHSIQHGSFSWLDWLTAEEVGQEMGGN